MKVILENKYPKLFGRVLFYESRISNRVIYIYKLYKNLYKIFFIM